MHPLLSILRRLAIHAGHSLAARLVRPWRQALAVATLLALAACGGGGSSGDTAPTATDDPAAVVRLQWVQAAPLFTASGQQHRLQVQALDAGGRALNVPIAWQSSAPAVVSVAAGPAAQAATLTAQAGQGTAVLSASVGSLRLDSVAVVAAAAPGTQVLTDDQIVGEPQATAGTTTLRVGSTYTLQLQAGVAAPAVGQLVLGQGSKAVAGEVLAVDGRQLTLALVPLPRLLPQLVLDLDLPLVAGAPRSRSSAGRKQAQGADGRQQAQAETSFSVAGFDCSAEGTAGSVELAKKTVQPLGLDSLRYRVLWNSQRQLLRLSGAPGVQFELEPAASLTLSGQVDCKLELADVPIPLPPSIGLFLGVGFPVGVGFTLEGTLPVSGVALNLQGQAQAAVVVGFDCNPGCSSLNSVTPTGSVTPTLTTPELALNRLDLSGQVYAWANFEGGARWSSTLQFDAIEAQAGLKFAATVATEQAQAENAAAAGQYVLSFEAAAGPTEALGDFADLVGLLLDQAKFATSVPLGRSPTAAFAVDKPSFQVGDALQFQVDLDAEQVLFPLQGYNVQSVRVYRKTVAEDGSFVLVLANEVQGSSGQTQFSIPWVATVDSSSSISFVAFVQTRLLSGLRWQVGVSAPATGAAVLQLSAGSQSNCVVTAQGGVRCWGGNFAGQLGNGKVRINSSTPVDVVGLGSGVQAVSIMEEHACALTSAGAVKCWGANFWGQLGNGSNTDSPTPVDVVGLGSGVLAIGVGQLHSCALTRDRGVRCWGFNTSGALGNAGNAHSNTPVDVVGLASGVARLSVGIGHNCVVTSTGAARCWGLGTSGQLGNGSFASSHVPVDVLGLDSGVRAIGQGTGHSCALRSDGSMRCWGRNNDGQLGTGDTKASSFPVDVVGLEAGTTALSVAGFQTCALTALGTAACWGENFFGQLGVGDITDRSRPTAVTALGNGVAALAAGGEHGCAVLRSGAVQCWGRNREGQLGNGSTTNSLAPVPVSGLP